MSEAFIFAIAASLSAGRPESLACAAPGQGPRRLYRSRHFGKPERDRLVLDERNAESLAFPGIGECCFESGPGDAHGLGGDADAPALEITERDFQSLAFPAQAQALRDPAILKDDLGCIRSAQAKLVLDAGDAVARGRTRDQEGADALCRPAVRD
jgi:hypothetical protein